MLFAKKKFVDRDTIRKFARDSSHDAGYNYLVVMIVPLEKSGLMSLQMSRTLANCRKIHNDRVFRKSCRRTVRLSRLARIRALDPTVNKGLFIIS